MRLLLVPLLMPLLIIPATTEWVEKGIQKEATEPVKYEIWLSPDRKLTAELLPAAGGDDPPDLVVDGAVNVVRLTPATSS